MIQRIAGCLGIAFLLISRPCMDLVQSQSMIRYHSTTSLEPLVLVLVLDLLAIAALFLLLIVAAQKLGVWRWLRILLAAWLPLLLLRRILLLEGYPVSARVYLAFFILALLALLYLSRSHREILDPFLSTGSIGLACLGASAILLTVQLIRIGMWRPEPSTTKQATAFTDPSISHPRLVWIVLDELSYDQTFEHRPHGLDLPALDEVRGQSVVYSMVQPIGDKTDRVMPSLLLGREIIDIHYSWSNQLSLRIPETPQWTPFRAADTPFALARQKGWSTGVVGWYNPYCSLLRPYLDECYWDNEDTDKASWNLPTGDSALSGALSGLLLLIGSRSARTTLATEWALPRLHRVSYQETLDHALALAANDHIDLALLHLPVPHYPNIYDRHAGQFVLSNSSYADNLALADRTLGQLLQLLKSSPRWGETTLIVCGDHSWRTSWWRPSSRWTAEDERISGGGRFDPRPVLMIHSPGQTTSVVNPEAVSLLEIHRILVNLIDRPRQFPLPSTVMP
jgi:hypothetical protein